VSASVLLSGQHIQEYLGDQDQSAHTPPRLGCEESKHKINDLYIGNVYLPTGELMLCGHTDSSLLGVSLSINGPYHPGGRQRVWAVMKTLCRRPARKRPQVGEPPKNRSKRFAVWLVWVLCWANGVAQTPWNACESRACYFTVPWLRSSALRVANRTSITCCTATYEIHQGYYRCYGSHRYDQR
jgi:hypothetical protein